jgi:saccharopine dehydrogenase-like NADP-dependent oxidoreductase
MKVVVLGAGLVGAPIAMDLAKQKDLEVYSVDVSDKNLQRISSHENITPVQADLSDSRNIARVIREADLVINAMPGFLGYQTLKTVLKNGKNAVDIAFFPENPFELDALARENNVFAIVDCGVAPGMSNILTGYAYFQLDETDSAITYVGGLPKVRKWPYEYKAVFSPVDVIEEYTRPARYVEHGQLVTRPALSDPEYIDFEGIGTLEAFNTDGLRTMMHTLKIPNMKEKTLRYPGHIEKMRVLRESGFFSQEEITVNGQKIRPLDVTAKLLFPMWELKPDEIDITIMRVEVKGKKKGKRLTIRWDLLDEKDVNTGIHSMARTTGYTATAMASYILKHNWKQKGIIAPEMLGQYPEIVHYILSYLRERNIIYRESEIRE